MEGRPYPRCPVFCSQLAQHARMLCGAEGPEGLEGPPGPGVEGLGYAWPSSSQSP